MNLQLVGQGQPMLLVHQTEIKVQIVNLAEDHRVQSDRSNRNALTS